MKTEDFSLTLEDAKRLYEEKLDSLRHQVGALERALARHQIDVDKRNETLQVLEREIATKQQRLADLSDKVVSGEVALREHQAKVVKTLDEREARVAVRLEAAVAAEAQQHTAQQAVRQARSQVDGLKADVLQAAQQLVVGAQQIATSVAQALNAV